MLTDGTYRFLNGGAWTQFFEMDEGHAEPRGYLAGTQTPDNMIHLITSRFYYKFNLAWVEKETKVLYLLNLCLTKGRRMHISNTLYYLTFVF